MKLLTEHMNNEKQHIGLLQKQTAADFFKNSW